jgi:hypothetical protein
MKIIDKTPLQNDKGEFGFVERIQGTLKYGFSWYSELESQKGVIVQLDRALVKGFVLIRNFTLPGLEVVEPIILIGPPGIYVIYVTHLSGFYEAKGDQWNTVNNGRSTPAADNLIARVARLAKALQIYLERQGVHLPNPVEPILIASSPAMHIDSMRSAVRVVMSDAVKPFSASLLQARPILQTELIYDLADRVISGHSMSAPQTPPPVPQVAAEEPTSASSRAQAIFRASESTPPLNPNDLGFAFEDTPAETGAVKNQVPTNSERPQARQNQARRVMGMTVPQLAILSFIFLCWICIMAAGSYLIFFQK